MAVAGLIKVQELRHLWRVSKLEFTVAAVALVGVLLFGILKGVVVAAIQTDLFSLVGPHRIRP
jgi:MFS superfamily sulfate permease-like transporter